MGTYDPNKEQKNVNPWAMEWYSSSNDIWEEATFANIRSPTPNPKIVS